MKPVDHNQPVHDPLLGIHAVMRITTLSRSTIHRNIKAGRFPASVQLTAGGRVGWRSSEIAAWEEDPLNWGREPDF